LSSTKGCTERTLFHVQFELLGLERYSDLFVRSFVNTKLDFSVPLEAHAALSTLSVECENPALLVRRISDYKIDMQRDYFFLTFRRNRSSRARSSGVNSGPKSLASNTWRI